MPKVRTDWLEPAPDPGPVSPKQRSHSVARWIDAHLLEVVYFRCHAPTEGGSVRRRVLLGPSIPKDVGPRFRIVGVRSFTPPGRLLLSTLAFEHGRTIVSGRPIDPGVWHLGLGADPEFSESLLGEDAHWSYQGEPVRFARADWGTVHRSTVLSVEYRATTLRAPWLRMALILEPESVLRPKAGPAVEDGVLDLARRLPDERDLLREASVQLRSYKHVERNLQVELAKVLAAGLAEATSAAELAKKILQSSRFVSDDVRRAFPELQNLFPQEHEDAT